MEMVYVVERVQDKRASAREARERKGKRASITRKRAKAKRKRAGVTEARERVC